MDGDKTSLALHVTSCQRHMCLPWARVPLHPGGALHTIQVYRDCPMSDYDKNCLLTPPPVPINNVGKIRVSLV